MDISKIITIAGRQGLHRVVAQGRQALIVESLIDGKRGPVHTSVRVSALDEISMFTTGDDVPLSKVLEGLYELEKGGPSLDAKTATVDELFAKLGEVLPEHDRERIYPSDVRKLFAWYEQLQKAGLLAAKAEPPAEAEDKTKGKPKAAKEGAPKKAAGEAVAKKTAAPKAAGGSKPKAATMRKSAQRGS
ncbi:MAG: DUF5606 domain-containing protein [Flavobacteriales bacterium]|jgi:hypothetical protein